MAGGRLILAVVALLLGLPLQAKVFTFDSLDCQCEIPDSWTFRGGRELINVIDPGRQRGFILLSGRVNEFAVLNSRLTNSFQQNFIMRGFEVVSQAKTTIGGVEFNKAAMSKDYVIPTLSVSSFMNRMLNPPGHHDPHSSSAIILS